MYLSHAEARKTLYHERHQKHEKIKKRKQRLLEHNHQHADGSEDGADEAVMVSPLPIIPLPS
jgi:hypothetical protein